jgi:hypothetical protein
MHDFDEQTTGDVTPDPGGYLTLAFLAIIVLLIGLFALALIISAA